MPVRRAFLSCLTLVVFLATPLGARPARADPPPRLPAGAERAGYDHAPVTLWLAPHVGVGGLASHRLRTNFALSLGASAYARLDGVDLGVGASWVTESVRGVQLTVGFNHAGGDVEGVQLSVGANVTGQRMTGLQLATGLNYGREIEGAQIGLVNVGGDVAGAQIGLVNVARRVKGAQIGLVNVAEDSTVPVGVVNAIRHGQHHLDVWGSESTPLAVGLKLGGRHVYSVLAAGFEASDGKRRWMAGLGIGGHVPVGERTYLEPELLGWHVNEGQAWSTDLNTLASLRLIGGHRVHAALSVFVGPTLNLLVTEVGDGEGFGLIRGTRLTSERSATSVRVWPGFVAGLRI